MPRHMGMLDAAMDYIRSVWGISKPVSQALGVPSVSLLSLPERERLHRAPYQTLPDKCILHNGGEGVTKAGECHGCP